MPPKKEGVKLNLMAQAPSTVLQTRLQEIKRAAEERAAKRRAEKLNLPYLDLAKSPINIEALGLISKDEAEKARAAVIEVKRKEALLVAFDPEAPAVKKIIKDLEAKGLKVKVGVGSQSSLKHVFEFYRFVSKPGEEITGRVKVEAERLKELSAKLTTLPLIKAEIENFKSPYISSVLEVVLAGALANRASDIHIESTRGGARLRLRVDGLLHDVVENFSPATYHALLSRLKLLSGLKLNVHNQPQDGRFTVASEQKEIEMRTSVIPAEFGETMVLRILDPSVIQLNLEELGLRSDDLKIIDGELKKPNGMILNTGPTGSGKTTTLYAFLRRVYKPETKVITIEDPIEYHLPGIEQTQVDPEAGYTFANGLRSILRQDPDVILVGEIRDLETAEIAMHASLTGHLVFSTLHTNEAAGAIPRLIDLGAKSAVIAPALNLIIAQRLVRRLCEHCKKPIKTPADLKGKITKFIEDLPARVDKTPLKNYQLFKSGGCSRCGGLGYRGRIGIFELFIISPEIEEIIAKEPTEIELTKLADEQGMVKMQEDGLIRALAGITTPEEVESVTGPIEWPV